MLEIVLNMVKKLSRYIQSFCIAILWTSNFWWICSQSFALWNPPYRLILKASKPPNRKRRTYIFIVRKRIRLSLEVGEYTCTDWALLFDMVVRRENLEKLNAVPYFKNSTIDVKSVMLSVHWLSIIQDPQHDMNVNQKYVEQQNTDKID